MSVTFSDDAVTAIEVTIQRDPHVALAFERIATLPTVPAWTTFPARPSPAPRCATP
ncbi:MAG: hypothetical protein ACLS7Z_09000 [Christensenellales bacterium]